MAGESLKAALLVNLSIGVIKTIVGLLTGSAAMISEAYHSFADTFNQILLAVGIRRSHQEPDLEHPFGYKKVQFFWAFVVAVLIFGISGMLALFEGISIIRHPEEHHLNNDLFIWQILVLLAAMVLEGFALRTAMQEAAKYKKKAETDSLRQAVNEMQDPVLLALLVEDSLALTGLTIAFIGSIITYITNEAIVDGFTSLAIGIILMLGGLLLANENKSYLVGRAVTTRIQKQIRAIVEADKYVLRIKTMRTMLLGPEDMLLALDLVFTQEAKKSGDLGVADNIDQLEQKLAEAIPKLTADRIFIESQLESET